MSERINHPKAISIHDARGVLITKVEYDADGNIVSREDGPGNAEPIGREAMMAADPADWIPPRTEGGES